MKEIFRIPTAWWAYDIYRKTEGGEVLIKSSPFKKNVIVENYAIVVAGVFKGDGDFTGGVKYAEVGEGLAAWGTTPPSALSTDTGLVAPLGRRVPTSKVFLDGSDLPTLTPTKKIQITFSLGFSEGDVDGYTIRELALVGGDATTTVATGYTINILRPTPEYKDALFRIIYKVKFEFSI